MAIYTSIENLLKRLDPEILAGLADDVNNPPDIDDADTIEVLNQAITDGANLIDSYLLGRVDLLIPEVQASLERINATLALYFLYRRRYVDDALNPLSASREAVCAQLADVAAGRVKLAGGDGANPEVIVFSTTDDTERVLDMEQLRGF